MGMAHLNFHPIALIKAPNGRLFAPYLPGTPALYPAHTWQKKMPAVLKDFSEFYLIDPAVAKNISDNGLRPLIESFVVCHRWYSKNMNRPQAQELLMREVKSPPKKLLKMFDCVLISLPCF